MVAGPGLERMRAVGTAYARTRHHRRTLVIRLVALHPRAHVGCPRFPCPLEFAPVALRTVAGEERPIGPDARGDEVLGGLLEDRAPFFAVGPQQGVAPPTLQPGGQFAP